MKHFTKLTRPYLIWSIAIVILPLILIVLYAFTTGGNHLVNIQFTLENFKRIGEPIYLEVLRKSSDGLTRTERVTSGVLTVTGLVTSTRSG